MATTRRPVIAWERVAVTFRSVDCDFREIPPEYSSVRPIPGGYRGMRYTRDHCDVKILISMIDGIMEVADCRRATLQSE